MTLKHKNTADRLPLNMLLTNKFTLQLKYRRNSNLKFTTDLVNFVQYVIYKDHFIRLWKKTIVTAIAKELWTKGR